MFPGFNALSMETTVSVFEIHYIRAKALKYERIMDLAQAVTYAMATDRSNKLRVWNQWLELMNKYNNLAKTVEDKSLLFWNGVGVTADQLRNKLTSLFGRRKIKE